MLVVVLQYSKKKILRNGENGLFVVYPFIFLATVALMQRLRKPMQQVTNFLLKHMVETAEID